VVVVVVVVVAVPRKHTFSRSKSSIVSLLL